MRGCYASSHIRAAYDCVACLIEWITVSLGLGLGTRKGQVECPARALVTNSTCDHVQYIIRVYRCIPLWERRIN
jgi:hypothetical protein